MNVNQHVRQLSRQQSIKHLAIQKPFADHEIFTMTTITLSITKKYNVNINFLQTRLTQNLLNFLPSRNQTSSSS